jgi:hypothetical protein
LNIEESEIELYFERSVMSRIKVLRMATGQIVRMGRHPVRLRQAFVGGHVHGSEMLIFAKHVLERK